MDLTLTTAKGKLNIRVAAVILSGSKILIEQADGAPFAVCPGGRVEFGETAEHAIERELTEELGEPPRIIRPLYIHQNFFDMDGSLYHELCFFFFAEVSQALCSKQAMRNPNGKSGFTWVDVAALSHMNFFPTFLKQTVNNLPEHVMFITEYKEDFNNGTV